jgi:hypothetical protein
VIVAWFALRILRPTMPRITPSRRDSPLKTSAELTLDLESDDLKAPKLAADAP